MGFRVSDFIIGLLLISFIVTGFSIFLAQGTQSHGITDYSNESIVSYNKLQELNEQAETLRNASIIESDSGVLDVIGSYFKNAYNALSLARPSFDILSDFALESTTHLKIGSYARIFGLFIIGSITVIFFVRILLTRILKIET